MVDSTILVEKSVLSHDELAILAKIPQTTEVRNHLIRYGYITDQIARDYYNISRLSGVIYKLRYKIKPLMHIETEMIYYTDQYGVPKQFGKYIFREDKV